MMSQQDLDMNMMAEAELARLQRQVKMMSQQELDMNMMAEAELARLQRQYRIMEGDRISFSEETSKRLAKQRKIINTLRREHRELTEDLRVATSATQKKKDTLVSHQLNCLLDDYDKIVDDTKVRKRQLAEVDNQIHKLEKQVIRLRFNEITDSEFKERVKSGNKIVQILENRLDTVIKRFCSVLTENKSLRGEIDHLLKERSNFNETWEKLLQDLNAGKRFILDLIEQATVAYDQREEWCSKLQALRARAQTDLFLHTQDMREMQRCLDHDVKLKDFLSIKGQRRIMKDLEKKELEKKEQEQKTVDEQVQIYQETLTKIQELTGEKTVDRIASQYIKEEEENFALFNYINELNHEVEMLTESIESVTEKIEEQKEINAERDQADKDTMDSLQMRLHKATKDAEEKQQESDEIDKMLKEILDGIQEIFKLLECDKAPILDLIVGGLRENIDSHNVMVYLGLINKKISDLVTTLYFKEKSMCRRKPKKDGKEVV